MNLSEWLDYQQRVHPKSIALGLDRVRVVAQRLGLTRPARRVITVAGTNGKGSTVAFIEAIARAAGLRVGCYSSPHLLRYNERVRIDGDEVDDAALIAAFELIEAARHLDGAAIPLTYFEFGTLAALLLFQQAGLDHAGLDLAVLEVGLGGRLDAVNLVDADVAVITTVDIDHVDWLGADRETIGLEKAGIARAGRPLVLGEADPPASVLRHAYRIGAAAIRAGCDYLIEPCAIDARADGWIWREPGCELTLPLPILAAPAQLANAAAAIAALRALDLAIDAAAFAAGVGHASVPGRLQRFVLRTGAAADGGLEAGGIATDAIEVIVDVAHNPQAARQLAGWLAAHPASGRTLAVFSALGDKDIAAVIAPVRPHVACWWLAGLAEYGERGLSVSALHAVAAATLGDAAIERCDTVPAALTAALAQARPGDRVLVYGSFLTAAAAIRALPADAASRAA